MPPATARWTALARFQDHPAPPWEADSPPELPEAGRRAGPLADPRAGHLAGRRAVPTATCPRTAWRATAASGARRLPRGSAPRAALRRRAPRLPEELPRPRSRRHAEPRRRRRPRAAAWTPRSSSSARGGSRPCAHCERPHESNNSPDRPLIPRAHNQEKERRD